MTNPYRYGGKYGYYNHDHTGIMLAGARWYHPGLFRWLTRDPIGYEGGFNLFQYVGGRPVKWVDPTGLEPVDWWDVYSNYWRAIELAQDSLIKHEGHNDMDDALRHAEWSDHMTKERGRPYAWFFGTCHELTGLAHLQPIDELMMDLHNNRVGRSSNGAINRSKLVTMQGNDKYDHHDDNKRVYNYGN